MWWWLTKDGSHDEVLKMKARLWIPPKGEEAKGVWSPESESAAFDAFERGLSMG